MSQVQFCRQLRYLSYYGNFVDDFLILLITQQWFQRTPWRTVMSLILCSKQTIKLGKKKHKSVIYFYQLRFSVLNCKLRRKKHNLAEVSSKSDSSSVTWSFECVNTKFHPWQMKNLFKYCITKEFHSFRATFRFRIMWDIPLCTL